MITLQPMNICQAAADLVWSRVIKDFPALRIALSEGGTGWIPYFLDRLDRTYDMHHLWTGQDFGDQLPSEVFREHFLTCFIADPVGIQLRDDDRDRQHRAGSATTRTRTRRGRMHPRSSRPCPPPTFPTTSSTRSPTRTRVAGTASIPSHIGP